VGGFDVWARLPPVSATRRQARTGRMHSHFLNKIAVAESFERDGVVKQKI
jgi:hypothetical protein